MASLMVQLKGIKGESRVKTLTLAVLATFSFGCAAPQLQPPANPLPSWNDGPARQSIIAFVERVTKAGGTDFMAPAERIATFDNDGTLWAEQPLYFQFLFAIDRVKALARNIRNGRARNPSPRSSKAT